MVTRRPGMLSVIMSPGAFFGVESYLRICTGVPAHALREGLSRLGTSIRRLG